MLLKFYNKLFKLSIIISSYPLKYLILLEKCDIIKGMEEIPKYKRGKKTMPIQNIIDQLRTEFPQAQVNYEADVIQIAFSKTHIATTTISRIEEIVFLRGTLVSNCKELIDVKNGTVFVYVKYWSLWYRTYNYLKEIGIEVPVIDIDIKGATVSLQISRYLNAAQLDAVQAIINEELHVSLINHDSIRVFGYKCNHTMHIQCNKKA